MSTRTSQVTDTTVLDLVGAGQQELKRKLLNTFWLLPCSILRVFGNLYRFSNVYGIVRKE